MASYANSYERDFERSRNLTLYAYVASVEKIHGIFYLRSSRDGTSNDLMPKINGRCIVCNNLFDSDDSVVAHCCVDSQSVREKEREGREAGTGITPRMRKKAVFCKRCWDKIDHDFGDRFGPVQKPEHEKWQWKQDKCSRAECPVCTYPFGRLHPYCLAIVGYQIPDEEVFFPTEKERRADPRFRDEFE